MLSDKHRRPSQAVRLQERLMANAEQKGPAIRWQIQAKVEFPRFQIEAGNANRFAGLCIDNAPFENPEQVFVEQAIDEIFQDQPFGIALKVRSCRLRRGHQFV